MSSEDGRRDGNGRMVGFAVGLELCSDLLLLLDFLVDFEDLLNTAGRCGDEGSLG